MVMVTAMVMVMVMVLVTPGLLYRWAAGGTGLALGSLMRRRTY